MRRARVNGLAVKFGEADLSTCDREPIHIPGSIQPHGVLLVIDRHRGRVEQVAGDTTALFGLGSERLQGAALDSLLEPAVAEFVGAHLDDSAAFIPPLMRLGVRTRDGAMALDLTLQADGGTAILELEPARRTDSGSNDPIAQLKTLLHAVQHTATLQDCGNAAAVAMRAATGFDRAMVYRFLPDGSGVVMAEDVNPGFGSFLGLHYPASDIPQQARELYRRNWLRAIPDIDYVPAPLQPAVNPRTLAPIDMSHCDLRSVSPIHLEYLRNMGVCASLSASIICRGELWGMLVLHHYAPRHVPAELRVACETFAQILSLHVEAKVHAETARKRAARQGEREELVRRLTGASDIGATLAAWDLAQYLDATGAAVYLDGRLHLAGATPTPDDILALLAWLNGINRPLYSTEHLAIDYPPAAAFAGVASGLVAAGLSRLPRDYVLWFRPEMGRTVRWAGNPVKEFKVDRHGARLTPRGSFAEWLEVTKLQSAPWSEVDLDAAEALRVVLLESVLKSVDLARRERQVAEARLTAEALESRVTERTQQLRKVAQDLEAAEERERRQIARDLHDDLGQILAAARIRLSTLCRHESAEVATTASGIDKLIERANTAIRSLAAQLAPDVLHELGLVPALEWLAEEMQTTFGMRVTVRDDGINKPLAPAARSILYRAVRELLINVAKHARTNCADVVAACRSGSIVITVSDAGVGFDADRFPSPRHGLGLITLRERMSYIGGKFDLRSSHDAGTTAVLTAPLSAQESGG